MKIENNITRLKAERFLSSFWILSPLTLAYYEANGLPESDLYVIQAVFAIGILFFEIPSGYISDTIGYKRTLLIGSLFMPLGIALYAMTSGFWGFAMSELLLAVGASLRSGTDSAILYDTLHAKGREKEYTKIEGSAFFMQNVGVASGSILGGFLGQISLRLGFWVNAATALLLLPICWGLTEPAKKKQPKQSLHLHVRDMVRAVKYCARHKTVRYASIYLALIAGLNMIGYWSYFIYFNALGLPVSVFGVLMALNSAAAGLGSKIVHRLEKKIGPKASLFIPLLAAPLYVLIGAIHSLWAAPLILMIGFLWGVSVPLLKNRINENARSHIRATILSVEGMGERLTFVLATPVFAYLTNITDIQTTMVVLGLILLAFSVTPCFKLSHRI